MALVIRKPVERAQVSSLPAPAARGVANGYRQAPWKGAALVAIKTIHSLIYFTLEFCVGYVLYTGLTKRQDRTTAIAAAAIGAESLIYFGNGRRCPLTGLAEGLGAARGSVTDIYLPRWLAARIFTIHAPLVVVAFFLHTRLLLHRFQAAHHKQAAACVTRVSEPTTKSC